MKRILLVLLLTNLLLIKMYGQVPHLSVSSDSMSSELSMGDSVKYSFVIHNVGNRDLEWSVRTSGPAVTFSKPDYADWNLAENQDRLTNHVWITRANNQGIFNAYSDTGYTSSTSPEGTEWAMGDTKDLTPEDYQSWKDAVNSFPPGMVGKNMSVHLLEQDLYFDMVFNRWTGGGNGGGFSYTREGVAPWLAISPGQGTTLPGRSDTVTVWFQSENAPSAGSFTGYILISSNDPDTPVTGITARLTVNGFPEVHLDQYLLDYKNVYAGGQKSLTVNILNNGNDTLKINQITTLSGRSDFIPETTTLSVPPISSKKLSIIFHPSDIQSYTDSLLLSSNDPDSSVVRLAVQGQGIAPSTIQITSTSLTQTLQGGTNGRDTLFIQNTGANDLLWKIDFSLDTASVLFTKKDYTNPMLPANQDQITSDVRITRGNLKGIYNAAQEDNYTDKLSPKGTLWTWGKTKYADYTDYTNWRDALQSSPPDMVGNDLSLYLPVPNRYFDVHFLQWTGGASGGGFSYERKEVPGWLKGDTCENTVSPGHVDTVIITFDANHFYAGTYRGSITISSNDPDHQEVALPAFLNITGSPAIEVDSSQVNFGEVFQGDEDTASLTVSNTGYDTLHISRIENDHTQFVPSWHVKSILPGQKATLFLTFTPTDTLFYQDTLRIYSDDPVTPVTTIPLSGKGIYAPAITINISNMTAELESGTTSSGSFRLDNHSLTPLAWSLHFELPDSTFSFTKGNYANWNLPQNQDWISDSVHITRQDNQGIYNIAREKKYDRNHSVSPLGTLWAPGSVIEQLPGSYDYWINAVSHNPSSSVGKTLSMFIPDENRYFNVVFTSWTGNNGGGGFSYTRTEIPDWMKPTIYHDTLNADGTQWVQFFFDATHKVAGIYKAVIIIQSNDPQHREKIIPVTMQVHGTPNISPSMDSIGFGNVYVAFPDTVRMYIRNTGTDTLKMNGITLDNTLFSVVPNMENILAGDSLPLDLIINPDTESSFSDTLRISSNDPDQPIVKIPVTATSLQAPDISVNVTEYDIQLYSDEVFHDTLLLSNQGNSPLIWSIGQPAWMSISDLHDTVPPGTADTVMVTIDATLLPDSIFNGNIVVTSNDPDDGKIMIPVKLKTGGIKLVHPLPDIVINEGFGSTQVDFSGVFESNGSLTYIVVNSDTNIVSVDTTTMIMTLHEKGTGTAIITLRADDGTGHVEYNDFSFRINVNPMVIHPVSDLQLNNGFGTYTINLDTVFYDPDGDTLIYEAVSTGDTAVTVTLNDTILTIRGVTLGSTQVYLSASDGIGTAARDTFSITVVSPQSVEKLEDYTLTVYPNPATDMLSIDLQGLLLTNVEMDIVDISGKKVYSRFLPTLLHEQINVSHLPKGLYFVNMHNETYVIIRKIIIR